MKAGKFIRASVTGLMLAAEAAGLGGAAGAQQPAQQAAARQRETITPAGVNPRFFPDGFDAGTARRLADRPFVYGWHEGQTVIGRFDNGFQPLMSTRFAAAVQELGIPVLAPNSGNMAALASGAYSRPGAYAAGSGAYPYSYYPAGLNSFFFSAASTPYGSYGSIGITWSPSGIPRKSKEQASAEKYRHVKSRTDQMLAELQRDLGFAEGNVLSPYYDEDLGLSLDYMFLKKKAPSGDYVNAGAVMIIKKIGEELKGTYPNRKLDRKLLDGIRSAYGKKGLFFYPLVSDEIKSGGDLDRHFDSIRSLIYTHVSVQQHKPYVFDVVDNDGSVPTLRKN